MLTTASFCRSSLLTVIDIVFALFSLVEILASSVFSSFVNLIALDSKFEITCEILPLSASINISSLAGTKN